MCAVKRFSRFCAMLVSIVTVICLTAGIGFAEEADVTAGLLPAAANETGILFSIDTDFDGLLEELGLTWANSLAPDTPAGRTAFVTGKPGQLPGNTGLSLHIPLLPGESGLRGVTGVECGLALTPRVVGQVVFDDIVAFLKEKHAAGAAFDPASGQGGFMQEGGDEFYVFYSAASLLEQYNIGVFTQFPKDSEERNVSASFQCGVLYDEEEFERGNIHMMFGPLLADMPHEGGLYELDLTETVPMGVRLAILFDGASDDALDFTFWLARDEDSPLVTWKTIFSSKNAAGLIFLATQDTPAYTEQLKVAADNGLVWADNYVLKDGSVSSVFSGGAKQLDSASGFSFSVPTAGIPAGRNAALGLNAVYYFTPENLGQGKFDRLSEALGALETVGGGWAMPDYSVLANLGLAVRARYPDGSERDITPLISFGMNAEMIPGTIMFSYGAVIVDREVTDEEGKELYLSDENEVLLSDGREDGIVTGTWWIASDDDSGGSGGGCSVGRGAIAGLILLAGALKASRRGQR